MRVISVEAENAPDHTTRRSASTSDADGSLVDATATGASFVPACRATTRADTARIQTEPLRAAVAREDVAAVLARVVEEPRSVGRILIRSAAQAEVPHFRSYDVASTPVRLSDPRPRTAMSVAVVGGDDFIMGRIRETLSRESIAVLDEVTEAPGLPEEAANASAILLVTGASAGERRTLVRTTAMSFPTTPVIVIASSSHGVPKALAAGAAGLVVGSAQ